MKPAATLQSATGLAPAGWWRPAKPAAAEERPDVETVETRKTGRLAFAALVFYSVVLIAAPQQFFPVLQPLRLAMLTGVLAIVFHLRDRWSGVVTAPRAPEITIALILVTWAIVTIPLSIWPGGSVGVFLDMYSKSIAVFLLLGGAVTSLARVRIILWVVAGCAALIGAAAVRNYVTGNMMPGAPGRIAGYGTSGLAGNPNDLALLLNLFLPLIGALLVIGRRQSARLLAGAALAVAVVGTIATFSRAGFLTLAVVGILHLWVLAKRGAIGWAAGVIAAAALVLVLAPPAYFDRLATMVDISSDQTGSAQNRWTDTALAAQFVLQQPVIGVGLGNDILALNEVRGEHWLSVHNVYLNYAVDLGVIGMLLFVALLATALAGMYRVERSSRTSPDLQVVARGLRISLIAFAVGGFFHPVAYHPFFYYIAGLAIAVRRIAHRQAQRAAGVWSA